MAEYIPPIDPAARLCACPPLHHHGNGGCKAPRCQCKRPTPHYDLVFDGPVSAVKAAPVKPAESPPTSTLAPSEK